MPINTNEVLIWLKNFKSKWLSQNVLNDPNLIESICNKILELEKLLIEDQSVENQTTEDQNAQVTDTDVIFISTITTSSSSSDIQIPIPIENGIKNCEEFSRPAIRIKRIPLDEAENYLPSAWRTPKSKRGQKKRRKNLTMRYSSRKRSKRNTQTPKPISSSPKTQNETVIKSNDVRRSTRTKKLLRTPPPPSITDVASTRPKNDEKKKSKRKLRTMDGGEDDDLYTLGNISLTENPDVNNGCDIVPRFLGQNGILSQTRKANETTRDEDFTFQLHSRKGHISLNDEPTIETVPIDDDVPVLLEDQQMLEHVLDSHDNESLFTSLEITHDKTIEISSISNNNSGLNYDDCIEDITNDGDDPPPSSSSPTISNVPLTT